MAGGESRPLGPWQDANLPETATLNAGVGLDADLPIGARFIKGVFMLLSRRRALTQQFGSEPVVFVLTSVPESLAKEATRIPMLDDGSTSLEGRVWFVNAPLRSGHFVERTAPDDDGLFRVVTEELEVGAVTTIVFNPRAPGGELRYYPNGLDDLDTCEVLGLSEEITVEGLLGDIERIHQTNFVTPGAKGGLWSKASKWLPKEDAELRVQAQLKSGLAMRYLRCEVRSEQENVTGRLDIVILERHPWTRSVTTEHAVIELKVLRSFSKGGTAVPPQKVADWIRDGVTQAASYRNERGSRHAVLACFDMRKEPEGDLSFEAMREEARSLQVAVKAWIVFATAKLLREYLRQHRTS